MKVELYSKDMVDSKDSIYKGFTRVWAFDEFDVMGDERVEVEKGKWANLTS